MFGSAPRLPKTIGGNGMVESSGRVCRPMSTNSIVAPNSLSFFHNLKQWINQIKAKTRKGHSYIGYIVWAFDNFLSVFRPCGHGRYFHKLFKTLNIFCLVIIDMSLKLTFNNRILYILFINLSQTCKIFQEKLPCC